MKPAERIIKIASLIAQESALNKRMQAMREKIRKLNEENKFYSSCQTHGDGQQIVTVALSVYLSMFPQDDSSEKPVVETYSWDGQPEYCRLRYPTRFVGYRDGKHAIWADAYSEKFDAPKPKEQPKAEQAAA